MLRSKRKLRQLKEQLKKLHLKLKRSKWKLRQRNALKWLKTMYPKLTTLKRSRRATSPQLWKATKTFKSEVVVVAEAIAATDPRLATVDAETAETAAEAASDAAGEASTTPMKTKKVSCRRLARSPSLKSEAVAKATEVAAITASAKTAESTVATAGRTVVVEEAAGEDAEIAAVRTARTAESLRRPSRTKGRSTRQSSSEE